MAILRPKNRNYITMSNFHLRDDRLSMEAKGLMSVILSFPDNWNNSIKEIEEICKENKLFIESTLKELEKYGYIKITKE